VKGDPAFFPPTDQKTCSKEGLVRTACQDHVVKAPAAGVIVVATVVGFIATSLAGMAAVKVRVDFDKTFGFRQARTWGWDPNGAGNVVVARTAQDDPEAIKQRVEPLIVDAVGMEMARRGLEAAAATPDLTLTYYLLLTIGSSSQALGQFLPSVTQWGLPPFSSSTTSFEVIERGSLVFDMSAKGQIVWRGIAEAQIKTDSDPQQREKLLRDAVKEILKRFPPKT
jgi:hypothetical protein